MKFKTLSLLIFVTAFADKSMAAFEDNARRYLSAHEIVFSIGNYFSVTDLACNSVQDANASLLGLNSTVTGSPVAPAPTQATVQWIASCISKSVENFKYAGATNSVEKLQALVGPEVYTFLISKFPMVGTADNSALIYLHLEQKWSEWPADIRDKMIASTVSVLLGSDEVIADFGIIEGPVLRAKLKEWTDRNADKKAIDILGFLSVNLAVRDEFLSY